MIFDFFFIGKKNKLSKPLSTKKKKICSFSNPLSTFLHQKNASCCQHAREDDTRVGDGMSPLFFARIVELHARSKREPRRLKTQKKIEAALVLLAVADFFFRSLPFALLSFHCFFPLARAVA